MTELLIASTLPGLLAAIDGVLVERKGLTILSDGADIAVRLTDLHRPIDVLILDDTITPLPDRATVEDTLWHLMYLAGTRTPSVRTLLIIRDESFPPQIRDPLIGSARESGGDAYVLPRHAGPQQVVPAVQWVASRLNLADHHSQAWLMPLSGAGGVGKSTQMANLALALTRRGYRVLIIDADFANGSLSGFFKIAPGEHDTFLTLNEEVRTPVTIYPTEAVQRRIYHHACGIDLLLSGRGVIEVEDMTARAMQALLATVRLLPYDVVCLDAGPDIKARPYAIDVLRAGGSGLIVCPPGRKERRGADNILALLRQMAASGRNSSMLVQAALIFVEAEHGSVAKVADVRRDMLHQYADVSDLGVLPRDARVVSLVAEREGFCTIYDIDPRGRYCQALELACDRLIAHLRLAAPTHASAIQSPPARGRFWHWLGIGRTKEEQALWS